jgi:hypothetical protein
MAAGGAAGEEAVGPRWRLAATQPEPAAVSCRTVQQAGMFELRLREAGRWVSARSGRLCRLSKLSRGRLFCSRCGASWTAGRAPGEVAVGACNGSGGVDGALGGGCPMSCHSPRTLANLGRHQRRLGIRGWAGLACSVGCSPQAGRRARVMVSTGRWVGLLDFFPRLLTWWASATAISRWAGQPLPGGRVLLDEAEAGSPGAVRARRLPAAWALVLQAAVRAALPAAVRAALPALARWGSRVGLGACRPGRHFRIRQAGRLDDRLCGSLRLEWAAAAWLGQADLPT